MAGTAYDVAVAATNSAGTSSFTSAVQATPAALIVLTITPKQTSRVYGTAEDLGFTVGGLVDGDSATDVVSGDKLTRSGSGHNAGSYTLSLDGLSIKDAFSGKYKLPTAPATTTYTITKKAVTYTSSAADKAYDGTNAAPSDLGGSFSPALVEGDAVAVTGGTYASTNVGDNIAISGATASGTALGNYTVTVGTITGDITKRSIAVAAAVVTRAYDGGTAFGGATLSGGAVTGEASGETLTLAVTGGTFASKNAGTGIAISSPTFSFTAAAGTAKSNYDLPSSITLTGTITKKSITVAAAVVTRTYDGTTAFGGASLTGGTVTGEVTGESLTLTVSGGTFASKNAGTGITINNPTFDFTAGANTAAGNYALPSSITLTGTINKKQITAIGGVTVNTRNWDGTTTATFNTSAATVTGVLTAEQANFRGGSG